MKHGNMDPALLLIRREAAFALCVELAAEAKIPAHCVAGHERDAIVVGVRHRFWSLLRELGWSYPVIGQVVERDHTTIRSATRRWRSAAKAVVRPVPADEEGRAA